MNRLKEILDQKDISQTWLTKQLGESFCIVNAYACNRTQPSLDVLYKIANILGVETKDLLFSNMEASQLNVNEELGQ